MDNSCMPKSYVSPNSNLMLCICMKNTTILDVRTSLYDNRILIASDYRVWKNTTVFLDCHIPNDNRAWCDVTRMVDLWHRINLINGNKDPYLIVFSTMIFYVQIKTYIITKSMLLFLRVSK